MAIFLPVVVTVVIAAVVGALLIVQSQQQTQQVSEADDAGNAFLRDVGAFRSSVVSAINSYGSADPARLRAVLDRAIADPPRLEDASGYGVERSSSYAEAERIEKSFMQPYRRLSRELRRADVALEFIAAARKVLALRTSDYIGAGFVDSSEPIRGQLLPAFVQARDEFVQVRVPAGQDELAGTVRGALQYVIDQATLLADSIEANRSFTFTYAEQFQTAIDAVNGYATQVKGDVTEAVTAVTDTP
ncbi:MAG: hypothetical protein JWP31_781 [Aeromicrobium sp.]|nr:hypothetical protein [Aeromicrobium sp.]